VEIIRIPRLVYILFDDYPAQFVPKGFKIMHPAKLCRVQLIEGCA
jgi:hypothetical protein